MLKKLSVVQKKYLWIAGVTLSAGLLISSLTPYCSPEVFFIHTYAAILFPYFLIGFLLWWCVALLIFKTRALLFLFLLIPAWKNTSAIFAFHWPVTFKQAKDPQLLRVLSWNVDNFKYGNFNKPGFTEKQNAMLSYIKNANADILCLQDYSEVPSFFGKANIAFIADSLGYPHHYFSNDCISYGTVIFSRFPIIDSGHLKYPGNGYPESLAFISFPFQNDTVTIYNTHLHSMYLHSNRLHMGNVGYFEFVKADTGYLFHSTRFDRMEYYDSMHAVQAKMIKKQLNNTHHPYIFCADMNSVPSGFVYQHLKEGLNDAFLMAGSGLGGTYHKLSLTLRIDDMLTSPHFKAIQYYSPPLNLSDHYPLLADFQIRK